MKNAVLLALAAFSVAGVSGASLAFADEAVALFAGPEMSHRFAPPADLPPGGFLPADGSAKSGPLGVSVKAPMNQSAFVAGSPISTPIIPESSLLGGNTQGFLRSPGGGLVGNGFASIKAASAAKSTDNDLVSLSATASSLLLPHSPSN
jgi:hypothetical protein